MSIVPTLLERKLFEDGRVPDVLGVPTSTKPFSSRMVAVRYVLVECTCDRMCAWKEERLY